jgi:hypothetical protein
MKHSSRTALTQRVSLDRSENLDEVGVSDSLFIKK